MNNQDYNRPSTSTQEIIALSKNPETEGFDKQAGETWIYPTNYTLREYQFNIIQEALLNNTMVSLPTGLGKTFIAAVVMYNFYRWYPNGKIIFMAPTRPLVKQQIDACYNIMAIPKDVTAELTGTKVQSYRKEVWKEKRVFFITPQILQNDISILTELSNKIKCIVFDEAHKAKGNHAYCEVIRKLLPLNKHFRVLGLSATPGSTLQDVLEVIHNLLISHLEIRTDESSDVSPYIFQRSLETVVIPLDGKLQQVRSDYMQILEKYTRVLVQHRVVTGNCSMLTKGKIFMTMKEYQEKSKNTRDRAYAEIMRNLNICVTLYHGYELLIRHGLRGFLSFFEEHAEKPILRGNIELRNIMQDVSHYLGPAPNIEPLPDGSIADIPESSKFGHPKFYKLRDILTNHFNENKETNTRVIVFCEYRESVMEAYALLLRQRPLVRPRIFLGQGAITQKQQINVIKAFKQGECNTLISTCIGEEGLDVGDVDLIVCFDINNKSPVRMVQRMGRTGRKRQGRVVILVTEGKEQQTLKECLIHKQNLTNHILQSTALYKQMYPKNPRMIPENITPKCHKMFITVKADPNESKLSKKKSGNVKDMFDNLSNKKSNISSFLQGCDIEDFSTEDRLPIKQEYFNKVNPLNIKCDNTRIDFSKKLGKIRVLQPTDKIGHSRDSQLLVSLLQFAESKKFNIPMSQVPVMPSQINPSTKALHSNGFKQTDIRDIFAKPSNDVINVKDLNIIQEEHEDTTHTKQTFKTLWSEVSTYLALSISSESTCSICENLFDCSQFTNNNKEINIKNWIEPDLSILDHINSDSLSIFVDSLSIESKKLCNTVVSAKTPEKGNNHKILEIKERQINHDDSCIDNFVKLQPSPFKPPDNLGNILKKCEISFNLNDSIFNDVKFTQLESSANTKLDCRQKSSNDSHILSTVNVETVNYPKSTHINKNNIEKHNTDFKEALSFFKLNTLDEVFQDFIQKDKLPLTPHNEKILSDSQDTIIYTPDVIIDSIQKTDSEAKMSCSPILCSFDKRKSLKHNVQRRLFEEESNNVNIKIDHIINDKKVGKSKNLQNTLNKPNLSNLLKSNKSEKCSFFKSKSDRIQIETIEDKNSESDSDSVPDVIDTSLETISESVACTQVIRKESKCIENVADRKPIDLKLNDVADLSIFGFGRDETKQKENITANTDIKSLNDLDSKASTKDCVNTLQDFCDDSLLGMLFEDDPFEMEQLAQKETNNNKQKQDDTKEKIIGNVDQTETKNSQEKPNDELITETIDTSKMTKTNEKFKERKSEEESIWDFCINEHNDSNIKAIPSKEQDYVFDKKEFKQSDEEMPLYQMKIKLKDKNKQEEKIMDFVDLTDDNPANSNKYCSLLSLKNSPTLIKSQRNIFSQFRSQPYGKLTQSTQNQNKNSSTQINSKLKSNNAASITSLDWFKKVSSNKEATAKNSKLTTKSASGEQKLVTNMIILEDSPIKNSKDEESDKDESFMFTFKHKKQPPKTPKSLLSLTKISPSICNKDTYSKVKEETPKKRKLEEDDNIETMPKRSRVVKRILESTDESDTDFESPTKRSTEWFTKKPGSVLESKKSTQMKKTNRNLLCTKKNEENVIRKVTKKKSSGCPYIDLEAEVSQDEIAVTDSDSYDGEDNDKFEESFVDDETQNLANNTMMHAYYLKSVKSPLLNRGKFKIPERPKHFVNNIYSQQVTETDNTYVNDSFCVNTEDVEYQNSQDISELELAELILEEKRKQKKKINKKSDNKCNAKRHRILKRNSSSDSDW